MHVISLVKYGFEVILMQLGLCLRSSLGRMVKLGWILSVFFVTDLFRMFIWETLEREKCLCSMLLVLELSSKVL